MNIIIMGPQGSGKTTQAQILAEKIKIPLVVMGNIFRELAKEDSDRGREIKEILEKGQLVSDDKTIDIVNNHPLEPNCANGFVLDGFPRNLVQAQGLTKKIDKVFYIKIQDAVSLKRLLLRGRADDTEETIANRLSIYHEETEPVLNFYRKQGILIEIDGERTVEEISGEIFAKTTPTQ